MAVTCKLVPPPPPPPRFLCDKLTQQRMLVLSMADLLILALPPLLA